MCLERTFCISVCAHCLLLFHWPSLRRLCLYFLCMAPIDINILIRWHRTFYSWGSTVSALLAFPHVSDAQILLSSSSWSFTGSALVCQHPKEASRGLAMSMFLAKINQYRRCILWSLIFKHLSLKYSIFKSSDFVTYDAYRGTSYQNQL